VATDLPNHLKLFRFHLWLILAYGLVLGGLAYLFWNPAESAALVAMVALPVIAHGVLAVGCRRQMEIARKGSVVAGVLLMAAAPIGTIAALYFLPLTQWTPTDEAASGEP